MTPGGEPTNTQDEQTPITLSSLAETLNNPWAIESFSPLGERQWLLLDTQPDTEDPQAQALCRQWLSLLPCPVIGIGASGALAAYTDTTVDTIADARALLRAIRHHPIAAMTLVQLLRHNQTASVEQGLLAESLAYATLQGGKEFQAWLAGRPTPPTTNTEGEGEGEGEGNNAVVLTRRRADTLHITLNRPQARNAFSRAMRDQLSDSLHLLSADPELRGAIVNGAGSCFSVGGDLTEFGSYGDTASAHAIRSTRHVGRLIHHQHPRIACHLHSACIGAGIELPAFAGHIVAAPNSFFQLPELAFGLIPGAGGTVSILRRIGRQRTAWLALSGKRINAARALAWGLIDAIEPSSPPCQHLSRES